MAQIANLKFVAEICLRVRIPPPAPDSSSRPVPLIEERGDFFRTRFAGSITLRRCQGYAGLSCLYLSAYLITICGSPFHISLPPVLFSLADASDSPIRFAVSHPYSAWLDVIPSPSSPRSLTDGRGRLGSVPLPASLSVQSASRLPPRLAFRSAARCLPYYPLSYTSGGEDACFSRVCPFSPSIPLRYVIH